MPQPTLSTARITLVPLADEHLEAEVGLDADPEVMRYLGGRARTRAEVVQRHRLRLRAADEVDGLGFWAGLVAGDFVGWWILQPPDGPDQPPEPGAAELGYRLARRWWRQGLAGEGARELLRYGFEDVGLNRIFAQTMAVNVGSRAVMSSLGMRYLRSFACSDDEQVEGRDEGEVEYSLARADWCRSPDP